MHCMLTLRTHQPTPPTRSTTVASMVRQSRSVEMSGSWANTGCCVAMREVPTDLRRLLDGERAHMAFLDPPYNVRSAVSSDVGP